jgi:hypothetical protein
MTHMHHSGPAVRTVVDTAVDFGCQVATILSHMEAFRATGASAPDSPPPVEVLRTLLCDTATPALSERDEAELLWAAHVVSILVKTIEDEILLVDPREMQRPRTVSPRPRPRSGRRRGRA